MYLNYTASGVPEPEHVLLLAVGALLAGLAIRRRGQRVRAGVGRIMHSLTQCIFPLVRPVKPRGGFAGFLFDQESSFVTIPSFKL